MSSDNNPTEGSPGFFASILRWLGFKKARAALAVNRSADAQFVDTPEGVQDAYAMEKDRLVRVYKGLRQSIGQLQAIIIRDKERMVALDEREQTLIKRREGAIALASKETDATKIDEHEANFAAFTDEIGKIDEEQADLDKRITDNEGRVKKYCTSLQTLQRRIQAMPEEEARDVADLVNAREGLRLINEMEGLLTSTERSPIQAVRESVRKKVGELQVAERLAGTDSRIKDAEYEAAGRVASAGVDFRKLVAARKSDQAAKTGDVAAQPTTTQERPRIGQ